MAISQKLHTKLVQKLILTPSLQQAIKLLPMSTLELSELLNQEMVENPMLEEVPTEELQPVEAAQEKQEEKPAQEKGDTWDDQDYEYFFGDYLDDGYRPRAPVDFAELASVAVQSLREVYRVRHPGELQYTAFGDMQIRFPTLRIKRRKD